MGKELLSNYVLFHICSVLKEVTGPIITLAWQENCLWSSPPVARNYSSLSSTLDNNQNLTTKALAMNDSLNETIEQKNEIGRKSNRPKKAISMKNKDFLW
jgi:hypothetical protein